MRTSVPIATEGANRGHRAKRTYTAATEGYEPPEARSNNSAYGGGPVQTNVYDPQARGFMKRQRSDSEYSSPHGYPAYGTNPMQQYSMQGNAAYGQQAPQQSPSDQQAQMVAVGTPVQQGMPSGWPRPQAPYSAPISAGIGMGGGSYFGSAASGSQTPRALPYTQQTSPQYAGRGSNEMYAGMTNLPTPVSEQSMNSGQSSIAGYGQAPQGSATLPSRGQHVQQYALSSPSAQYPPQPQQYGQPPQQYQLSASNAPYDPHQPPGSVKMEVHATGYGNSPTNMYQTPTQQNNTYPVTEGFSSNDLPLSSAILNREFTGAYQQQQQRQGQEQAAYTEMSEGDLAGFQQQAKSQSAAYPTPHQTSPTQLQDHG